VTFAIKVSVSASLSADVSVEIPIQIINFVSLDPPPGHAAAEVLTPNVASRIGKHLHLSRCWSVDELRAASMQQRPHSRSSSLDVDSLRLSDLNLSHNRSTSYDSHIRPSSIGYGSEASSGGSNLRAPWSMEDRHVRHKMSLDSIGSAIASATARRLGHQRSTSNLCQSFSRLDEDDEEEASEVVPPVPPVPPQHVGTGERPRSYQLQDNPVQLDELQDEEEEELEQQQQQQGQLAIDYDSEDEVDMLLRSSSFDDDDDDSVVTHSSRSTTVARPAPPQTAHAQQPFPSMEQSVHTTKPAVDLSNPNSFMASPSSPIKARVSIVSGRPGMVPPGRPAGARARVVSTPARMPSTRRPSKVGEPPSSAANSHQSATSPRQPARRPLPRAPSPRQIVARVRNFSTSSPDLDSVGSSASSLSSPRSSSAITPPTEARPIIEPKVIVTGDSSSHRHQDSIVRSAVAHSSPPKKPPPFLGQARFEPRITPQSVKSKVAALEDRQAAISAFSGQPKTVRRKVSSSSAGSSRMDMLSRNQSIASFKAPLLRGRD
jgi:hypothetical protein